MAVKYVTDYYYLNLPDPIHSLSFPRVMSLSFTLSVLKQNILGHDDVIKWKIFRVTGLLCGEFTGPGEFPAQRPVTRSFDVFFDLRPNKRLSKQPWGWWFETLSWSLWCHCNEKQISIIAANTLAPYVAWSSTAMPLLCRINGSLSPREWIKSHVPRNGWEMTIKYNFMFPKLYSARQESIRWNSMYSHPLQWRYSDRNSVSNHRRLDCLIHFLIRRRSKKTSKLTVTGLCEGNPPVTGDTGMMILLTTNVGVPHAYQSAKYLRKWYRRGVLLQSGSECYDRR